MRSELLVVVFHLLAFVLLMQGLFPYSSSTNNIANRSCFTSQGISNSISFESTANHVILMIIDALRVDYVFNRNTSYYLKSVEKLEAQGKAQSIRLRTHTPTVTLPRLKALLTGTIPSFWDVLFNYNSSRLELDNLLYQYKQRYPERKMVFYGDDTWIKLFPDSIFDRAQGLQSFFVTDFHEIDLNVTLGLNKELERMHDWNLLIVHYLVLDHIGHAIGAFNSHIEDKLSEMDEVIERIYSKLNRNDLLVITGDHGMADKGGHGGSSYVETHVPAVFVSKQFDKIESDDDEYLQIDLTATLSGLLGIAIPWNNLGILIENILKNFYSGKSSLLKCLIADNRRQLFNLLSHTKLSTSLDDLQLIRDQAMAIANQQDLLILIFSLILFIFSTTILYFHYQINRQCLLSIFLTILIYFLSENIFLSLSLGAISCCLLIFLQGERNHVDHSFRTDHRLSKRLLKFYPFLHLFSLFSSSFIEEEHQTWYYFFSSYLLVLTIEERSLKIFLLFICSRLIRNWNQTGNKWLHLSDLADFFNEDQNRIYLFLLHLFSSICLVFLINKSRQNLLFPIIVLIYRWNSTWICSLLPLIYYSLLMRFYWKKQLSIENLLFLLLYLITRPHNCLIIVIHLLFYRYLKVDNAHLAFLLSQCAFFHLGNSNSFVTIDISSGFVGIPIYLPLIHGILIYLSTYGLSLIWLLKLSKDERRKSLVELTLINSTFSLCIFLQRSHLFVWSVFAPKVFYLCAQTAVFFLLFF